MVRFPLMAAGAFAACLTVAAPAQADPPTYPPSYGSNGTFAVGTQTRSGLSAFIPPGRYRASTAPGYFNGPGFWLRCNNIPCTANNPANIIGNGDPRESEFVDVLPTDAAVYLYNVTLTFAG